MKITRLGSFALGVGLALAVNSAVDWFTPPPEPQTQWAVVDGGPNEILFSCFGPEVVTLKPVHNCSPDNGLVYR